MTNRLRSFLSEEQDLDTMFQRIKSTISQIYDKAKEKGIEPIKVKVDSAGSVYKFTIQAEFGSCSNRFDATCLVNNDKESIQVRDFLIRKLVNKLVQIKNR